MGMRSERSMCYERANDTKMSGSEQPNVVWISLESTRADHSSAGGRGESERDTMPNVRRLAERADGRSFEECHAHGIWTKSAVASILTGTAASRHDAGMNSDRIPGGIPTVAERFADVGYATGIMTTNANAGPATGVDRGFDEQGWLSSSTFLELAGPLTVAKYVANLRRHSVGYTTDASKHATSYLVTEAVKRWVDDLADDQPAFMYLHYGDPHFEYSPPRPSLRKFADDVRGSLRVARQLADYHATHIPELIADGVPLSEKELENLQVLYDALIEYTDERIQALLDHIEERWGETIVVITADHGELFGERRTVGHRMTTHTKLSRVPLVTKGLDAAVEYDGELVQHADIMRTILEEVGADTEGMAGIDLRTDTREYAVVQRGERRFLKNRDRMLEHNPAFENDGYLDGTEHAILTEEYVYRRGDDRSELLSRPDEGTDVSGEHPDVAAELDAKLDEWLADEGAPFDGKRRESEVTPEMQAQLENLGYL